MRKPALEPHDRGTATCSFPELEVLAGQGEPLALLLQASPLPVLVLDRGGCVGLWNAAAEAQFGWTAAEVVGRPLPILPADRAEEFRALTDAVLQGPGLKCVELRCRRKDGSPLDVSFSASPLRGAGGTPDSLVALVTGVEERKRAEQALEASDRQFRAVFDGALDALVIADDDGRYVEANPAACALFGLPRPQLLGRRVDDFAAPGFEFGPAWQAFLAEGRARGEFRLVRPDGSARDVEYSATAHFLPGRHLSVLRDVTARKRAAEALRLLAEAGDVLASSLDYATTLDHVARLAVPQFADWCVVYVAEEDGSVRHLAVAHRDPARCELMREMHRRYPLPADFPHGFRKALRAGQPDLIPAVSEELLQTAARDAEHLCLLRGLGIVSNLSVPLRVGGRILGAMTFATAESGRRYDAADVALAEELARRAAVAIDNARLYGEVRLADRRKDEFLALLGHELRNPLAPIRNSIHLLRRSGVGDPLVEQTTAMMDRQVRHLTRLVDDLLDVSRITRGKVELRKEPTDLAAVVARAVESSRPLLEGRRHQLTVSLAPEPLRLEADPTRLEQVLANLLTNAAKYTEVGGRIEVFAERDGGQAVLRVRDNGIGIRPEMLARVFDLFTQADPLPGRLHEGLGIGLTLVRSLVELHGGTVAAASAGPGRGSEFVVRLPLDEGTSAPAAPGAAPAGNLCPGPLRVLAVDDNTDAVESLALFLRLQGHDVCVAYDGPAALEAARALPPEVVLLDIGLPGGMDGYEVARRLRQLPGLGTVPLVALTGYGQEEDRRLAREAGFNHHLTKPVDPQDLENLLARLPANG